MTTCSLVNYCILGLLTVPAFYLGRLWIRLTRCWWTGHLEPPMNYYRRPRFIGGSTYWSCERCGKVVRQEPAEMMDCPENDEPLL